MINLNSASRRNELAIGTWRKTFTIEMMMKALSRQQTFWSLWHCNGETNVGIFILGNRATAYVASTNSTDVIIQLKNGEYLIVGTLNTNAFASIFSQDVYPLKSL